MDKRYKRNEASDKKIDNKVKDRGDNLNKKADKIIKKNTDENNQVNVKPAFPERGDSERKISTNQKPEKMRINIVVKNESKFKTADIAVDKEPIIKKNTDKDGQEKAQDFELRKRIRDKYTLKLKSINKSVHSNSNLNKKDDGSKIAVVKSDIKNADRPKKQLTEETTQTKEKLNSINSSISSGKSQVNNEKKPDRGPEKIERNSTRRKPMIKTIMSKNGSVRIYKAVTFVDQKHPPTPLEINIPGDSMKKQKVSKFTDTSSLKLRTAATVSRASIKEKPVAVRKKTERKRDRKNRHMPSPDISIRDNISPPTEVARWAPSSIDRYTKPYYEAWVNTTLAAISKSSKKDRLFYEKQRKCILESFQRALQERPISPELFYENFHDEKYTGRIKITHR